MANRHPNWLLAESILARVIPGARVYYPDEFLGLVSCEWENFDIEDRDPAVVADDFVRYCTPVVAGTLVIAAFESFRSHVGPFFVDAKGLREFVIAFDEAYEDVLLSGDTIVVSAKTGVVVVVHHDGLITTVRGVKDPEG